MKYTIKVRRYETVIRDLVVEVETVGKRKAEHLALDIARAKPEEDWGAPSGGHDLCFEADVIDQP